MKQGSLFRLWMDENASQQSNKISLMKENLQYHRGSTTKLARTVPTQGKQTGALNRCSVLEILLYIGLDFLYYESKMDQNYNCNCNISVPTGLLKSTACTEVVWIPLHIS